MDAETLNYFEKIDVSRNKIINEFGWTINDGDKYPDLIGYPDSSGSTSVDYFNFTSGYNGDFTTGISSLFGATEAVSYTHLTLPTKRIV